MSLILARPPEQAYVRPSEGAGTTTLTSADNKWQIFNLTAARTCVLPSADIKAGEECIIENRSAYGLTVQSSGFNPIEIIGQGRLSIVAVQDAPTSASHWMVGLKQPKVIHGFTADATSTVSYALNSGYLDLTWRVSGAPYLFSQGGGFTPGSTSSPSPAGRFIVPPGAGGTYQISGKTYWSGANMQAGAIYALRIFKNDAPILPDINDVCGGAGQPVRAGGSYTIVLADGDSISAKALSGANHAVLGAVSTGHDETILSVVRLG